MAIKCCKDCVAPKRHPGCHSVCSEYLAQKAEYEKLKEIHDKEKQINMGIYIDRNTKVYKAMQNRRNKKI